MPRPSNTERVQRPSWMVIAEIQANVGTIHVYAERLETFCSLLSDKDSHITPLGLSDLTLQINSILGSLGRAKACLYELTKVLQTEPEFVSS